MEQTKRTEDKPAKKTSTILNRLPKLSRLSHVIVLVGVFVVLLGGMLFLINTQSARYAELRSELTSLQAILVKPVTEKESIQVKIDKVEAEIESSNEVFPKLEQSTDIVNSLYDLAESNDVVITKASTVMPDLRQVKTSYPALTFTLSLDGQVPKFQNFLLAVGDRYPTSEIRRVDITIADEEGEEDKADITIDVHCYQGG
jgi:Tfp pilus assembly protein PilO